MNTSALRQAQPAPGGGVVYRMVAPRRADAVRVVRDWVVSVLRANGCGRLGERARLCASEVATNVYLHTDSPEIAVEVTFSASRVTVCVFDCEPGRWPEPGTAPPLATRGRGLLLVAAHADDWAAVVQGDCVKAVWFGFAVEWAR
ncbi:ATP-binding protein [Streptomyces sp. NPDC048507]|uniref:ATP-binding protein n=1 Tax=Streptomyces sp. NPDC048507 TaxID=3365560 RepID=UPI00371BAE37